MLKFNKIIFLIALLLLTLLQACVGNGAGEDYQLTDKGRLQSQSAIGLNALPKALPRGALPRGALPREALPRGASPRGASPRVAPQDYNLDNYLFISENRPKKNKPKRLIDFKSKAWLGDQVSLLRKGQTNLPRDLTRFHDVVFVAPFVNLNQIADELSKITGIATQIRQNHIADIALIERATLRYRGPIKGLLNIIANQFEAHWFYDPLERQLVFERLITRQLDYYAFAPAPPSPNELSLDKVSAQNSASRLTRSPTHQPIYDWRDIQNALKKALPLGSRVAIAPNLGKITITTTPPAMMKAIHIVNDFNQQLLNQIHLNVEIIQVKIPQKLREDGKASAPSAPSHILRQLIQKLQLAGSGARTQNRSFSSTRPQKINGDRGKIFQTLSQLGEISTIARSNHFIRNGQSLPMTAIVKRTHPLFANDAQSQNKDKSGQSSDLQSFDWGLELDMRLHPLIIPRRRVKVDFGAHLQSLDITSLDKNGLEKAEKLTLFWKQEAIIPDKATLLISGFETGDNALGSSHMMIILITPHIIGQKI